MFLLLQFYYSTDLKDEESLGFGQDLAVPFCYLAVPYIAVDEEAALCRQEEGAAAG